MAHRKMILTEKGASRGFYRTRMLKAGDALTMDGPTASMNLRMGWAEEPPVKRAKKAKPAKQEETVIPTVDEVLTAEVVEEPAETPAEEPAAPKKAPAKRRKAKAKK